MQEGFGEGGGFAMLAVAPASASPPIMRARLAAELADGRLRSCMVLYTMKSVDSSKRHV